MVRQNHRNVRDTLPLDFQEVKSGCGFEDKTE